MPPKSGSGKRAAKKAPAKKAPKKAPVKKSVAVKEIFSSEEEIRLIDTVRDFPILWRRTEKQYMNRDVRPLQRKLVGETLGKDADDCKNKWNLLYGHFRRVCGPKKSGDPADKQPSWKHTERMSFVRPYINKRKGEGNFSIEDESENDEPADEGEILEDNAPENNTMEDETVDPDKDSSQSVKTACSSTPVKANQQRTLGKKETGSKIDQAITGVLQYLQKPDEVETPEGAFGTMIAGRLEQMPASAREGAKNAVRQALNQYENQWILTASMSAAPGFINYG